MVAEVGYTCVISGDVDVESDWSFDRAASARGQELLEPGETVLPDDGWNESELVSVRLEVGFPALDCITDGKVVDVRLQKTGNIWARFGVRAIQILLEVLIRLQMSKHRKEHPVGGLARRRSLPPVHIPADFWV